MTGRYLFKYRLLDSRNVHTTDFSFQQKRTCYSKDANMPLRQAHNGCIVAFALVYVTDWVGWKF